MNLALFATARNASKIEDTLRLLGESQTNPVNGKLVILHSVGVGTAGIQEASRAIASKFKVAEIQPVQVNHRLEEPAALAVIFSTFILKQYAKSPGGWLIIDDYARPNGTNVIDTVLRQHQLNGKKITGRGLLANGALIPAGPITLELPAKDLKVLISQSGESFRNRGKYLFARAGFGMIDLNEYAWDLTGASAPAAAPAIPSPPEIQTTSNATPRVALQKPVVPVEREPQFASPVAAPQETETDIQVLPLTEISGGDIAPDIAPIKDLELSSLGRNELYNLMWGLTGEKPHPQIGEKTLTTRIEAIRSAGE